ncbi:hypothetical protein RRG08_012285 [Elysia crispata]|uniref:Uncharacterized protein n=1 Tax=Elysia crispata TaxID=231223 RepID=A0AAE1ECR8_9GAST|nr:hypothetical protein RRG08_012285 [Elysia crispata]
MAGEFAHALSLHHYLGENLPSHTHTTERQPFLPTGACAPFKPSRLFSSSGEQAPDLDPGFQTQSKTLEFLPLIYRCVVSCFLHSHPRLTFST